MIVNDSILIIGQPASGKTTFIAQFLTRVRKRKSSIKLFKIAGNIKAIQNAIDRLAMGEEPETTPSNENVELVIPIDVDGKKIDIVFPDYGGEQVNSLIELMEINENWQKLVINSDLWIHFIRPHEITPEYDLSMSSFDEIETKKSKVSKSPGLSNQSKFIELLQILLHTKNQGVKNPFTRPKLSIVLTCWDELNTDNKPVQVLREKLPLFLHFVESVWGKEAFEVLGLSAQEFPLKTQEAKDKYIDELPETFGYIIDQNGVKFKDITKLVKIALQL